MNTYPYHPIPDGVTLDDGMTLQEILAILQAQADKVGQENLARSLGISKGHMSKILSGERNPGIAILHKLGVTPFRLYMPYEPFSPIPPADER